MPERWPALATAVMRAAEKLSAVLGYGGSSNSQAPPASDSRRRRRG